MEFYQSSIKDVNEELYPLKFEPIFKDYIWGGKNLKSLNKSIHSNVAESWEISCLEDDISIVSNGTLQGKNLKDLLKEYGESLLGTIVYKKYGLEFPLLIKFIDANKDLSIQVHPGDDYVKAMEKDKFGKNELWYIIKAKKSSKLVYGLKDKVTKEEFTRGLEQECIDELVNYIEVKEDDTIYVPAGKIHAIGKGIVLLEIQQSSNFTYRVYDYNRKDKQGRKRELHIDKALDVINFKEEDSKEKESPFLIEKIEINNAFIDMADGSRFFIYICLSGKLKMHWNKSSCELNKGDSVLIPANLGRLTLQGRGKILKTYTI